MKQEHKKKQNNASFLKEIGVFSMKPIIGIVAKHYKTSGKRLETFIRDEVEQAIFDNGGIAIGILPPNEDKIVARDNWQDQLTTTEKHNFYDQIALCDGILLQGGCMTVSRLMLQC